MPAWLRATVVCNACKSGLSVANASRSQDSFLRKYFVLSVEILQVKFRLKQAVCMEKMSTPNLGPKIYVPWNGVLSWKVLGNLSQRANSYRRLLLKDQAQISRFFLFIFCLLFSTSWFLTTYPGIFHILVAGYFGPSPSLLSRWENNPSVFCFTVAIRKLIIQPSCTAKFWWDLMEL